MYCSNLSGGAFAGGVRRFLRDLGLSPEDAESVIDAGQGPGLVYEAFAAYAVHIREADYDHVKLAQILPQPFGHVPQTLSQTKQMLKSQGLTPPRADTPAGFFNKLRCEAQLNILLGAQRNNDQSFQTDITAS
jgi:hypothetical protein